MHWFRLLDGHLICTHDHLGLALCRWAQLLGLNAQTIPVPEKHNVLTGALGLGARFNPLAHTGTLVHGLNEADGAVSDVRPVVAAHDGLDSLGGFVGVVEWNSADIVVQDVCLNDTVEEVAADETELAVDGRSGTLDESPLLTSVVRQGRIGVLKEGDGNCCASTQVSKMSRLQIGLSDRVITHQASG